MWKINDIFSNRYLMLEHLRDNGVTSLWLAKDQVLGRMVRLEILGKEWADSQRIQRFYDRTLTSAKLLHPNISLILDCGENQNLPYNIKLFIQGRPLKQYIAESKNISSSQLLTIFQQLASSVDYLHSLRIAHRNLKSTNILIGDKNEIYLDGMDVLYHGEMDSVWEKEVDSLYNAYYQAPENWISGINDFPKHKAGDIYALGVLLYEILTQSFPFSGTSLPEIRNAHLNAEIPLLTLSRPDLPKMFDVIIQRLLAKDIHTRYSNALDVVNDLTQAFYSGQSSIQGRVFISYATKDKDYVHQLAKELRRLNIDIWIDQDIEKGSDWGDSIETALKETDIMLLILSETSAVSEYVTHEWSFFMGSGKPVYPFVLHSSPAKEIHPRLRRVQHIMGTGDMFNDIARIIDVLVGGNPSRIPGKV